MPCPEPLKPYIRQQIVDVLRSQRPGIPRAFQRLFGCCSLACRSCAREISRTDSSARCRRFRSPTGDRFSRRLSPCLPRTVAGDLPDAAGGRLRAALAPRQTLHPPQGVGCLHKLGNNALFPNRPDLRVVEQARLLTFRSPKLIFSGYPLITIYLQCSSAMECRTATQARCQAKDPAIQPTKKHRGATLILNGEPGGNPSQG